MREKGTQVREKGHTGEGEGDTQVSSFYPIFSIICANCSEPVAICMDLNYMIPVDIGVDIILFAHDLVLLQVESPWLVEPYSVWILVALNGVLLLGAVLIFLVYLLAYRLCCQGRCVLEPLWPIMTAYEYDIEGVETQKYLAAVLRGRALIGE